MFWILKRRSRINMSFIMFVRVQIKRNDICDIYMFKFIVYLSYSNTERRLGLNVLTIKKFDFLFLLRKKYETCFRFSSVM